MKDIKSLYLTAKSSGNQSDINAYMEHVHDLLENKPNGYMSDIEYIISSNIGLTTLKEFIERHGLSLAAYDPIMEQLEIGLKKSKLHGHKTTPYEEAIAMLESFADKYQHCFIMYESYKDKIPEGYLEAYYRRPVLFRKQNQKVMDFTGNLSRFGEAAIPDMLIFAESIGTFDQITEWLATPSAFSNPTYYQWIWEAMKDFSFNLPTDVSDNRGNNNNHPIYEKSLQGIYDRLEKKKFAVIRESALTHNDDLIMEYSGDDIRVLEDIISFKEYYITCLESTDEMMELQKEIYAHYEAIGELIQETVDNKAVKTIVSNMKTLSKKIITSIRKKINAPIKAQFGGAYNDGQSEKLYMDLSLSKKVENIVDELNNSKKPLLKDLVLYITIGNTGTTAETSVGNDRMKEYNKIVREVISDFDDCCSIDRDIKFYGQGINQSKIRFAIYLKKEYLLKGVKKGINESFNYTEIYEAIKYISEPMFEDAALSNTHNKYTGQAADYIKKNHAGATWGEDDDLDISSKGSPTLDHFKRPSIDNDNKDSITDTIFTPIDNALQQSGINRTPQPAPTGSNYYLYNYNYNNSFNKQDSHNLQANQDHSVNKGVNSDGIGVKHNEDTFPWELNIPGENPQFFNEGFGDVMKNIGGMAKKAISKIRSFLTVKKNLANLQKMDLPSNLNRPIPLMLPGTNIPMQKGSAIKEGSYTLDEFIGDGDIILTESFDGSGFGLSKNDIKNIINKLRSKFKAEILFIHRDSPAASIVGPAAVISTTRQKIQEISRGKQISDMPNMFSDDQSGHERVILVNPSVIAAFNVKTPRDVEFIISHEYGHVLTFSQISQDEWAEYLSKVQMVSGIVQFMYPSNDQAVAEMQLSYWELKPEKLANTAVGINPIDLMYAIFKKKPTGILKSINMKMIVDLRFPQIVIDTNKMAMQGKMPPVNATIEILSWTKDFYKQLIMDQDKLQELCKLCDDMMESYNAQMNNGYGEGTIHTDIFQKSFQTEGILSPDTLNIDMGDYIAEGWKDVLVKTGNKIKNVAHKVTNFIKMRMTSANIQLMDLPENRERPIPLSSVVIGIPCDGNTKIQNESFNYYYDLPCPPTLEEFIEGGLLSKIPKNLNEEKIQKIMKRLSQKYQAHVLFVNSSTPLGGITSNVGGACVIAVPKEKFVEFMKGNSDYLPTEILHSNYSTVILVNADFIAKARGTGTEEQIETIFKHEYGHVLTFKELTPQMWIEYRILNNFLGLARFQYQSNIFAPPSPEIQAVINATYHHFKIEDLANKKMNIKYNDIIFAISGLKVPSNWNTYPLARLNGISIPPEIINIASKTDHSIEDKIADTKFTMDVLKDIIPKERVAQVINQFQITLGMLESQLKHQLATESKIDQYSDINNTNDNKPSSDRPIRDTFMDIDRELTKTQQSAKKVVQGTVQTGKVFVKPAQRTSQWMSSIINQWKDADENKIKEKMADPHTRSGLWKVIKAAIVGGSLLKAGLLLNPFFLVLGILRGAGKNKKEFRLRNEMLKELETELQVIDEKIKDASFYGDTKAKYQLMRFKSEIEKKRIRIGTGPTRSGKRAAKMI